MKPALLQQEGFINLSPAEPLWQRVPTRDESGKLLGDFMMIIPGLNRTSQAKIKQTVECLNKLLTLYQEFIVFADLNMKINTLWVSHKPHPGIGVELAAAIYELIPEARLVAERHE